MGHSRALELTVTCERFSAERAHEYGLVTHLVPDGEELTAARDLAAKIIEKPVLPVTLTKATMKAIRRGTEMGEATYSDADLLLYTRRMQRRAARRESEKEA
jgi:enoyl-CoA hydratase/carnithine racemase